MPGEINSTLHNFNYKGFKYVYPVVSRRLGGLSVGINLVNYCNWDCVYCDAPKDAVTDARYHPVDLQKLRQELDIILGKIQKGELAESRVQLKSITVAGNGEPTLCNELGEAFKIIGELRKKYSIGNGIKTLLITNGSCLGFEKVQDEIRVLSTIGGEVWFKIDSIIESSILKINRSRVNTVEVMRSIEKISIICPLYIQTCFFKLNNQLPTEAETFEYICFLASVKSFIKGVYLYTASRKPFATEGEFTVEPASLEYLEKLNSRILQLGIESKFFI